MTVESKDLGCVLVADDDRTVLRTTARLLQRLGYTVVAVPCGVEAVAWLERDDSEPAAAVIDHSLADLPGPHLFGAIQGLRPGLPTLVISGLDEITALRAYTEPRPAFLSKPYNLKRLAAKLAELV